LFHSDTQSIGKTELDVQALAIDFWLLVHKFHGPKGVGFAFIRKNSGLQPFFGEQEKDYEQELKRYIRWNGKSTRAFLCKLRKS
jgi:cysteine sulfinate desulfinase/cysteine desulfurase-like protein